MPEQKRWWRYAVLRGPGIPLHLDGKWFDLEEMNQDTINLETGVLMTPTDRWEQREGDGAIAVRYEWTAGRG